jgi:hypothetical protein
MLQWYWHDVTDVYKGIDKWHDVLLTLNQNKFSKEFYREFCNQLNPSITEWKSQTIRGGQRFAAGEFFRPCVWTGKPYRSLQMQFLPALYIPKTWGIDMILINEQENGEGIACTINGVIQNMPVCR